MIFIRRSLFSALTLVGIIGVIYFMSNSSNTIETSINNISSLTKDDLLPKFNQQPQQQQQQLSQPAPNKPLEEIDTDESVEQEPPKGKESDNVLQNKEKFTDIPFMPKMANETLKAQLGNASWKLFHTILARYPDEPTDQERSTLENYIYLFAQVYPCGDCARHFTKLLAKYPPQTKNRKTAALWGCYVHNIVNEKLHKPEYDCTTILEDYDCGCGDDEKEKDYTLKGESMDHLRQIKIDSKKDKQRGG
ncbi:FAD-linked sulfhydryl oxidase, putative [Candida dubliniensis CD36]|uniref:Sulfhydryl oxidase n=1 Tax=Candida dubliniensis (strain CD36 / ATCC MYA-646 / CBS 7987 / NCPF 3949 / NRRL Y-17841) TaxID=573826 RepID=B9WK57_CANDC|nr:FAD-linked sulfhydryl oxidase, putative [Candida dubliniensis CD36]CAX40708.1 FAD-linked sulfhydryl oxidase, putative [Candida dubliniensis CD36]